MDIPRITPQEVAERIRHGDAIAFVDARSPKAHDAATAQIPGSVRVPPGDIDAHVGAVPRGGTIVAYCT
jgi:rhodanese-related sulfurtransferase